MERPVLQLSVYLQDAVEYLSGWARSPKLAHLAQSSHAIS